jgi:hypothetical protein
MSLTRVTVALQGGMFTTPAILVAALAISTRPLTRAEVESSTESAHVLAYDSDDQVAAEIVIWRLDGKLRLDALFPDGVYLTAIVTGDQNVTIEGDDPDVVAGRLAAIEDLLGRVDTTSASKWKCALEAALAVGACASVHAFACIGTTVLAACECLPLIVDEFEGMECLE